MQKYRLSIFDNTFKTIGKETSIAIELKSIKEGLYNAEILGCRNALLNNNPEKYKKLKSSLKAVTFCGMFSQGRRLSNLIHYNRLIVIDIDDLTKDELTNAKELLKKDLYIMAIWDSPSGLGLKGLVKVNSAIDSHKKYFISLSAYFLKKYRIELDKSGSDITRLCYVSWDENIYINENSNVFSDLLEPELKLTDFNDKVIQEKTKNKISISLIKSAYATEGMNKQSDKKQIKKIILYLKNNKLSITNDYSKWIKVAAAISNTFSFDIGEDYYLQLCRLDNESYDEIKSRELLKHCYNNRSIDNEKKALFSTIIYEANLLGFIVKK